MQQQYSTQDDDKHTDYLLPIFNDPRYIKINDNPLFIVYRTEQMINPLRTAERWRERAQKADFKDIHLARVESFTSNISPLDIGFDCAIEFAPDWRNMGPQVNRNIFSDLMGRLHPNGTSHVKVFDYNLMATAMLSKEHPPYPFIRCVTPSWDNTARRKNNGTVLINSTPEIYQDWLNKTIVTTVNHSNEPFVFINAWNEWAEGNHLEPDQNGAQDILMPPLTH